MNSRIFLFPVFVLCALASMGQSEDPARKTTYFFSVHTGGLLGAHIEGSSFTASLKQGVRLNKAAFGLGVGYDAFAEWRTVPVSLLGQFDFLSGKGNNIYLETEIGYAKAWLGNAAESQRTTRERGGILLHPQLGYRINAERVKVYVSVGYKLQRIEYEQTDTWWGWGQSSSKYLITRDIGRLSVQIGVGLF